MLRSAIAAGAKSETNMQTAFKWAIPWITVAATVLGCSKEEVKPAPAPAPSTPVKPLPTPPPAESAAPPAASATAAAPAVECPKGSSGEGTFDKPCEATGTARMMEVTWTGKTDDKGPTFRVVNKSPAVILHGKIAVYFYDKAGKQLDVPDPKGDASKTKRYHTCGGFIFGGIMKPAEKAVLTFSCVKKERVPEGTAAIEAEMQMVGFADSSEKKVDYYWRNKDLTPDERRKGGVKK
jgi:hypothetical protein